MKGAKRRASNVGQFGEADYRAGALERLADSELLLQMRHYSGGIYLAGRAAEGMLRAVLWTHDREIQQGKRPLETGHDLRQLLLLVRDLGLLRPAGEDELEALVQKVGRLWFNNMRFAPTRLVEKRWRTFGEVDKRHTIKQASADFYEMNARIVKRCQILCQKQSSRKS